MINIGQLKNNIFDEIERLQHFMSFLESLKFGDVLQIRGAVGGWAEDTDSCDCFCKMKQYRIKPKPREIYVRFDGGALISNPTDYKKFVEVLE